MEPCVQHNAASREFVSRITGNAEYQVIVAGLFLVREKGPLSLTLAVQIMFVLLTGCPPALFPFDGALMCIRRHVTMFQFSCHIIECILDRNASDSHCTYQFALFQPSLSSRSCQCRRSLRNHPGRRHGVAFVPLLFCSVGF